MLEAAELTNAPQTGFATLAADRLNVIETLLAQHPGELTLGWTLALLGCVVAETAALETIVLRVVRENEPNGSVQADVTARINEAIAAAAHAYGALDAVHKRLGEPGARQP